MEIPEDISGGLLLFSTHRKPKDTSVISDWKASSIIVAERGKMGHWWEEKRSKPPEMSSGILELLLWVVVPGERMKMTGVLDLGSAFFTASKFLHVNTVGKIWLG